jgi:hypothetical protein
MEATGKVYCGSTPYNLACEVNLATETEDEARIIFQFEVDFLKSLLPENEK